jgi:hypothetical protein
MIRTARRTLVALTVLAATMAAATSASATIALNDPASFETYAGTAGPALGHPQVVVGDLNRDGNADAVGINGDTKRYVALGGASGLGATAATDVGSSHQAIALADLNRDGIADLLREGTNGISVYAGTGSGTFSPLFDAGGGQDDCASSVQTGDLDRDGDLDAVATCPDGSVHVHNAGGFLLFSSRTDSPLFAGHAPTRSVLADVNRDGKLDLVANESAAGGGAYVALGNGDRTFGLPSTVIGIGAQRAIAVADLNRDGKPDLVGLGAGTVSVALGNGDGTFAAPVTTPLVHEDATDLAVGDLDHDGRLDVVVGGPHGVDTLAGNGDGTLAAPVNRTAAWATAIALGDVNDDGRDDVVLLNRDGTTIEVALNASAITAPNVRSLVTPQPTTGRGPVDTTVADVNRDGIPDLVVAEQTEYRVGVFLGNGDGTYQPEAEYWPGGSNPSHPVVADMNGDGFPDIVVGNYGSASISVMLGNGDGTFVSGASAKITALGTFSRPQGVVVADFNRDGIPDAAVSTDTDSQKVLVMLGTGDGTLGAPTSVSLSGNQTDLVAGDFDRDGKVDLASVAYSYPGKVRVLHGQGDGTFAYAGSADTYGTGGGSYAIRAADMNHDGILDLVTANLDDSTVSVLFGTGNSSGAFGSHVDTSVASGPRGLALADVDGDGDPDVVESAQTGTSVGVLANDGTGALGAESRTTVGDSTYAVAAGDLNRDGLTDIVAPSYTGQKLYVLLGAVDQTAPTTTDNVPAWTTTSPFRPTLTATDTGGGAVAKTYYTVGNPPATPTTASAVYNPSSKPSLTNGQQISYFSVDSAGNVEAVKTSGAVGIDAVKPTTSDNVPTAWQKASVRVTLTPADTGGSGVDKTYYTIGTNPSTPNTSSAVYDPANKPTLTNGQKIRYFTRDVAGNSETSKTSIAAKVDTVVPTVSDNVPSGWQHAPVTVTLTAADTGGSGLDKVYYELGASPAAPTTASSAYDAANKPVLHDGEKIRYVAYDVAGNDSGVKTSAAAQVDAAAPATTDDVPTGWAHGPVSVTLNATDGGSGVATTYYETGTSPATPTTSSPVYDPAHKPVLGDGQKISYFSVDVAGNAETPHTSIAAQVDGAAPVTSDDVPSTWSTAPVTVTLTAVDGGSGGATTYYEIGASPATPTTSSAVYDPAHRPTLDDGQKISYFSVDVAGNAETPHTSIAAQVDGVAPVTSDDVPAGWRSSRVTVTLTADDSPSGVAATYYEIGATPATPTAASPVYDPAHPPTLGDGESIRYYSVDHAGNAETPHTSVAARVDENAPTTTDDVPTGWQDAPIEVTLTAADTGGSGVATTYYETGASPAAPTTASTAYDPAHKPVLQDGERIRYFSVDSAGNAEAEHASPAAQVDVDTPMTTDDVPTGWHSAPISVTLTAADTGGSGVAATYYEIGTDPALPTASSGTYDAANKPVLHDGEKIRYFSVDNAGNAETPHASIAAQVEESAPGTNLVDIPPPVSPEPSPHVTFTSDQATATFECALDGEPFAACTSPYTPATPLADGDHTLAVRAVNRAGVADASPASVTFRVDTTPPPAPGLVSGPPARGTSTSAAIAFTGEGDATFDCSVDGAPASTCTSPLQLTGLALGSHSVRVAQTDAAGLRSEVLSLTFTVVAAPPTDPDPTSLSVVLGPHDRFGARPPVLVAGVTTVACAGDRGRVARCALEMRSRRSLLTTDGPRVPAGTVLATGTSSSAAARSVPVTLHLTESGRRVLARHPFGVLTRIDLSGTGAHGKRASGTTRVRMVLHRRIVAGWSGRRTALPKTVRTALDRLAHTFGRAKSVGCTVDTDRGGSARADLALTQAQADAACARLRHSGLKATLTAVGRGHAKPRASNRTAVGRALNRRLTLTIVL